jgi:folylpolyglutamate synthase/dihydropteroate synthase
MEVGLGGKYDATNVVCIVFISAEVYWSNIT